MTDLTLIAARRTLYATLTGRCWPFPITGAANKAHLQSIETKVKGWVDEGRTVSYSVKVTDVDANLRHDKNTAERRKNKVNAKFRVQATVKQKGNKPAETIRPSPIVSRYDEPSEAAFLGAQSGSGRQTFRLSEKSINELKSLNGVTAAIARKMKSEADKGTSRISSYERLFGISKENLDSANPGFRLLW